MNGSVFLDFNYTADKRIYLRRISFDGYGCCNIDDNDAICLDRQLSKLFADEISKDVLDQDEITKYVLALIQLNKDNIWEDALECYRFIFKR